MAKKKKDSSSSSSSSSSDAAAKETRKAAKRAAKLETKDKAETAQGDAEGAEGGGAPGRGSPSRQDAAGAAKAEDAAGNGQGRDAEASGGRRDRRPDDDLEEYKKRKMTPVEELEKLGRSGGVYIPPFKLARLQQDIEDKTSPEFQRQAWEALRKSINGLVNKVNCSNIKNLVEELFQENLVRGRGLFVRAIIRAQMASPGFTHVFAALVSVMNSKLPDIGDLIIRRVILQFRRAYKRHDKIVTTAAIKFMAHLVNQKVASELLALHVATLLLEKVSDDSIEVCVAFMQEVGQAMEELSPAGAHAIYERFRHILHEGEIDKRVQYVIEGLHSVRKKKYSDNPMVLGDLDLVDEEDQVTHEVDLLDDTIKGEETLNIFKVQSPEDYAADEAKWKHIAAEILGIEEDDASGSDDSSEDSEDERAEKAANDQATQKILDFTEQDLVNLRRSIYLVIQSSLHFEECVHKILKLNITDGQEKEVCTMLIDICAMDKTFNKFFALQAERLCRLQPVYQERFSDLFDQQFATVHRLETNKLRNIGKFFALLLYTDAIPWSIMAQVKISEETTTSSSRIFVKVILQEICEQWGVTKLKKRLEDSSMDAVTRGLFPTDHPKNTRFAINFFTAIGLGILTENLRQHLAWAQEQQVKQAMEKAMESSAESESSSSSSSSDSDSSDSS